MLCASVAVTNGRPTRRHAISSVCWRASTIPEFVPGMCDVVKALAGNCSLAVISSNGVATIRAHTNPRECSKLFLTRVRRRCRARQARECQAISRGSFLLGEPRLLASLSRGRAAVGSHRRGDRSHHRYCRRRQTRSRMRHPCGRSGVGHAFREAASASRGGVCRPLAPGTCRSPSTRRICSNFLLRCEAAPRARWVAAMKRRSIQLAAAVETGSCKRAVFAATDRSQPPSILLHGLETTAKIRCARVIYRRPRKWMRR